MFAFFKIRSNLNFDCWPCLKFNKKLRRPCALYSWVEAAEKTTLVEGGRGLKIFAYQIACTPSPRWSVISANIEKNFAFIFLVFFSAFLLKYFSFQCSKLVENSKNNDLDCFKLEIHSFAYYPDWFSKFRFLSILLHLLFFFISTQW